MQQNLIYRVLFGKYGITSLWHMTHRNNVRNILRLGILNYYDAHRLSTEVMDISEPSVQRRREKTEQQYGRKIHDYVALYINPRNPMLYCRKYMQDKLCLISVSLTVLGENQYLLSDGNAASSDTNFYASISDLQSLPWGVLMANYWTGYPDGKRKRCSEVLVHSIVSPRYIQAIHCCSKSTVDYLADCKREVFLSNELFF